ncbi:aminotransferase class V-fold PLP-dependent enzyme [Flagellimonas pacifica]|uniref:Selenocysteine lyase/Cysteine desulfurase n=1 Tax=Flagellimonas pacifica TaxID=1247520 RepID=A0A285MUT3_9FLAO|nr:aminotransferase class V-fold PLP-dependent enzyme [Allomuricauda parva]SNZ00935.1 Selenocysteine lyase/Cysteine desulfurase [Allomuricauda parva]
MQNLRKKFPVLNQCIYANTAATGLLSEDLMEWRQEHDLDYLIGGSAMKQKSFERMGDVRSSVANFFSCNPQNIALVPNFTLGLNMLLEGLSKKMNVLLLENDYPSLNWPFETRDFQREYIGIDECLEETIHAKVKTGKIDVLALSLVQWVNGIKIDLDFIKKLKNEFPNLLIIADGTQFCGTQKFNFQDSGIDVLGASAYKWLLAGYGNGFLLVKDEVMERFDLKFIGNGSVDRDISKKEDIPFCKYLEPGHLDSLNFGSLQFSLNFLDTIGLNHITAQLEKLSIKAKEEFGSLGLLEEKIMRRPDHSTIFNIKGDEQLFNKLAQENVVGVLRGNGIRLSFHFYNTENEIDIITDILKS